MKLLQRMFHDLLLFHELALITPALDLLEGREELRDALRKSIDRWHIQLLNL
jgi:hypothetical protein